MVHFGTILVCEEDSSSREWISKLLTVAGYSVHTFAGQESVDELIGCKADLALVGISGAGSNGFDITDGLRLGGMRGPIVFLVESADTISREEAASFSNIRGILEKPLSPRELLETISGILQLQELVSV